MRLLALWGSGLAALGGLGILARAGTLEARGRLAHARVHARRGGFVAATGGAGLALLGGSAVAAALALGSAAVALTSGLAGKPRPSVWFAAAFLLGALAALLD